MYSFLFGRFIIIILPRRKIHKVFLEFNAYKVPELHPLVVGRPPSENQQKNVRLIAEEGHFSIEKRQFPLKKVDFHDCIHREKNSTSREANSGRFHVAEILPTEVAAETSFSCLVLKNPVVQGQDARLLTL